MNRIFYIGGQLMIMCFFSLQSFSQKNELSFSKIELDTSKNWSWHLESCAPQVLSDEDVVLIDSLLRLSISSYNSSDKAELLGGRINFAKYKYQFVGGLNEQGEKEVWINAFCIDYATIDYATTINWFDEIIEVNDGGNCFFNLKVNINIKTTSDFYVNGF